MANALKDRILASRSKNVARVKPMWEAWRIARPDHVMSDSALELAVHVLKRREAGYQHARHSPSTANHCIRRSVFQYLGHKGEEVKDPNTLVKFDGGNFGHLRWQMYFHEMGLLRGAEVVSLHPDLRVAGTCDGIMDIPLEGWDREMTREEVRALIDSGTVPVWSGVLEIKEMFSRRWTNNRTGGTPEAKTRWQGDLYCIANQRVDPSIEGTVFWFENKDTNELCEFDLPPTDIAIARMQEFYGEANALVDARTLPPRPYKNSDYECRYCPLLEMCQRYEAKGKTTIKPAKGWTEGDFTHG